MYLWHPEVHITFREHLHYFVLTVRPFNPDEFRAKMLAFQKKERIGSLCLYEVFGAYDVVMRIWLPLDKLESFDGELRKAAPEVDKIIPFRVTEAPNYWAREQNLTTFNSKSIGQVTAEQVRQVQNGNHQDVVDTYVKAGLLTKIEQTKKLKFFIALSNPHAFARIAEQKFREELREIMNGFSAPANLSRISIYYGFGFAWALIKAEIPPDNFFVIGAVVDQLSRKLFAHGFYTTTYIGSNCENPESDAISEQSLISAEGFDLNAARLVPDLYRLDVPVELVPKIIQWIHSHRHIEKLDESQRELITRCLSGVVQQDEKAVFAALQGFFIDTERYLRPRWPQFLNSRLGQNKTADVLRGAKVKEGTSSKLFALGDICNICVEIIRQKHRETDDKSLLSSNWQDLAYLRNAVAHGSCEPLKEWETMLTLMVDSFAQIEKLKAAVERELSQTPETQGLKKP